LNGISAKGAATLLRWSDRVYRFGSRQVIETGRRSVAERLKGRNVVAEREVLEVDVLFVGEDRPA
jgi:hypothetical protein